MKIKLTLVTLTLLAATTFAQPTQSPEQTCAHLTQTCEASRIAYIAGCMATGRSQAMCSIDAQGEYLTCLSDIGCYEEEQD